MARALPSLIGLALSVLLSSSYVNCRRSFVDERGETHKNGRSLFQTATDELLSDEEQFKRGLMLADAKKVALLAPKVDVNTAMFGEHSPLHVAVSSGFVDVVKVLLGNGADPNAKFGDNQAPLHKAAYLGDAQSTAALIEAGADVRVPGPMLLQPLHYAALGYTGARYNKEDMSFSFGGRDVTKEISGDRFVAPMESLLAQFANHRIPHHLGVVSLLLNAGADVDATSDAGETPLHFVAVFDRFQTAKMLITAGANLEIADVQKETPLHEAAAYAARGVVQVLLASGANSYAKEEHSLNPREFICKCISYHFDESLNQCAPGRCLSVYDRLVVESMIDQARGL